MKALKVIAVITLALTLTTPAFADVCRKIGSDTGHPEQDCKDLGGDWDSKYDCCRLENVGG